MNELYRCSAHVQGCGELYSYHVDVKGPVFGSINVALSDVSSCPRMKTRKRLTRTERLVFTRCPVGFVTVDM